LPRGWKFEFYASVRARGESTGHYVRLGEITTEKTTSIDLGKVKISQTREAATRHVDEE